ncbi:ubiquitin-protein ligase E3 [Schizosaccharomyces cryophilus OY26]|uniref:Ubiquitin-protein ligase E3 n=1 Tax=Schizosaccharomyces cryophilus (strain OY26 / ATCC MYA-4695 / CBS 11777 / NBRC 106824 / NRRL Y48691) TaxID=653667 RepID=S9WZ41_SCHCR|nr:ubiquitin-protein ligase E3 [Schizosaccharomyces cryophilus OY26]EPY49967.1 ubiquitin-protein ligase E3 [Schizosaccharomyces cryophilus OY26]
MGQANSRPQLPENHDHYSTRNYNFLHRFKSFWKRYVSRDDTSSLSNQTRSTGNQGSPQLPSLHRTSSLSILEQRSLHTDGSSVPDEPVKSSSQQIPRNSIPIGNSSLTPQNTESSMADLLRIMPSRPPDNSINQRLATGSDPQLHCSSPSIRNDHNHVITSPFHEFNGSNSSIFDTANETASDEATFPTSDTSIPVHDHSQASAQNFLSNNNTHNQRSTSRSPLIDHLRQYLTQDINQHQPHRHSVSFRDGVSSNVGDRSHSSVSSRSEPEMNSNVNMDNRANSGLPPETGSAFQGSNSENATSMLSRLLSAAAIETAASIMNNEAHGPDTNAHSGGRQSTVRSVDGSFEHFLDDLRNGNITNVLQNSTNSRRDAATNRNPEGDNPEVQYLRMFRFPSSRQSSGPNNDQNVQGNEQPGLSLVPVLIVCMRNITDSSEDPTQNMSQDNQSYHEEFRDNISINDITERMAQSTNSSNEAIASRTLPVDRFSNISNTFDHYSSASARSEASLLGSPRHSNVWPSFTSASSSLPSEFRGHNVLRRANERLSSDFDTVQTRDQSDHHQSTSVAAADETPSLHIRRSHIGSGDDAENSDIDRLEENQGWLSHNSGEALGFGSVETSTNQLYQDSISLDNNRHNTSRGFGSADEGNNMGAERAGDEETSNANSNGAHGDWLIYVFGGLFPEYHPILTTVSLFSDNPTYEDLLALTSYLGPAKKPVATAEDLNRAGGLFLYLENDNIVSNNTCLICLEPFERNVLCRRLKGCKHFYHKDCIDQWLTTGNNSCPLCRSRGVKTSNEGANQNIPDVSFI